MKTNQELKSSLPTRHSLTLAHASSLAIAALMGIASLAGLLVQTAIYPTDELLQSFVPNDVVNLVIGLPILLGSMWLARRGKLIGLLFWPGALFTVFYTYLVYVFGMPLGGAFLLHLTLVTLSAYTMIGVVASIDGEAVRERLAGAVPERAGGGVLVGLGALFLARAVSVMLSAIISQTPVAETELALSVSDAVMAPSLVIGGVLLWRRETFGYVTGLGLLFQTSMLFIGLIVVLILQPFMTAAQFALGDVLVISVMGLVCFIPFALFVRGAVSNRNPPSTYSVLHQDGALLSVASFCAVRWRPARLAPDLADRRSATAPRALQDVAWQRWFHTATRSGSVHLPDCRPVARARGLSLLPEDDIHFF